MSLREEGGVVLWHCFSCGIGGDAIDFHQRLRGFPSASDALADLEREYGGGLPERSDGRAKPATLEGGPPNSAQDPVAFAKYVAAAAEEIPQNLAPAHREALLALGGGFHMDMRALHWEKAEPWRGKPSAWVYEVLDPDMRVVGIKLRYLKPYTRRGTTLKSQTLGRGGMIGLRQLQAMPQADVVVVAGEKDAKLLKAWCPDFVVLTATGEAQRLGRFATCLRGRRVTLCYDMDATGRTQVRRRAAELSGAAAELRVCELPLSGTKEEKDIADYLRLHDGEDIGVLRRLLLDAPLYVTDSDDARGDASELKEFYWLMTDGAALLACVGDLHPIASIDRRYHPVQVGVAENGRPITVKPSIWLARTRPVEQATWAPGLPRIIEDRLIALGGWCDHAGARVYNQYLPPQVRPGNARKADPWLDHVARVYPGEAAHIIQWLAHRVQHPGNKCNHAIIFGGKQGIGKDSILYPVRKALGDWNCQDVSPQQFLGRFNGFLKAVLLVLSEARDLGDINRYNLYDHAKAIIASPPDTLRIDEKNRREYYIPNVVGLVVTTNHTDGVYLPPDDRRHFVAWSELDKSDFSAGYWTRLYDWYEKENGCTHVAAYLLEADISGWDPKAPPPQTEAWREIVSASQAPETAEATDAVEALGKPEALTISDLQSHAEGSFRDWLCDRTSRRMIPHRLRDAGYVGVMNPTTRDGRWKVCGRNVAVYARADLKPRDRVLAARRLAESRR